MRSASWSLVRQGTDTYRVVAQPESVRRAVARRMRRISETPLNLPPNDASGATAFVRLQAAQCQTKLMTRFGPSLHLRSQPKCSQSRIQFSPRFVDVWRAVLLGERVNHRIGRDFEAVIICHGFFLPDSRLIASNIRASDDMHAQRRMVVSASAVTAANSEIGMIDADMLKWLEAGGCPLDLKDAMVPLLMRECGADNGSAHFASALVIDMVRDWILTGQPKEPPSA